MIRVGNILRIESGKNLTYALVEQIHGSMMRISSIETTGESFALREANRELFECRMNNNNMISIKQFNLNVGGRLIMKNIYYKHFDNGNIIGIPSNFYRKVKFATGVERTLSIDTILRNFELEVV